MKLMKRGIAFAAAMAMASMPLAGAFMGASTAMAAESPTPSIAATASSSATSSATSNATPDATSGSQVDDLQAADGGMRGGPDGNGGPNGGPGGNDGNEGPGYGRYHKPGFVEGRRDDDEHFTDLEMISGVLLGAVLGGAGVAGSSYVVRRRRQKKAERKAVNVPATSADASSPVNIPVVQPSAPAASSADTVVSEPAKDSEPVEKTTKTDAADAEVNKGA